MDQSITYMMVHVTPRSGRNVVVGVTVAADDAQEIRLRVTAAPDKGKANKAVCKLLASSLDVSRSSVEIIRGATARHKRVAIHCSPKIIQEWIDSLPRL